MISASAIVAGSNSGRALRTIWVTDSDSSAWRSSTISEKHSAKYGSSANCGNGPIRHRRGRAHPIHRHHLDRAPWAQRSRIERFGEAHELGRLAIDIAA